MSKPRVNKLTENPVENVSGLATYRLNMALGALRVFGSCCGERYAWTEDQIIAADKAILAAAELTIRNITDGKPAAETGVQL